MIEEPLATIRVQKNVQSCGSAEDPGASSVELHDAIGRVLNQFGIKSSPQVFIAVEELIARLRS